MNKDFKEILDLALEAQELECSASVGLLVGEESPNFDRNLLIGDPTDPDCYRHWDISEKEANAGLHKETLEHIKEIFKSAIAQKKA